MKVSLFLVGSQHEEVDCPVLGAVVLGLCVCSATSSPPPPPPSPRGGVVLGGFYRPHAHSCDNVPHMSEDLRYPVGKFSDPIEQTDAQRRASLATMAALPENLRSPVDGLTEAQLDTPYREGGWTVRQLVHHVADSHINAYVRTRLALTEDWPAVKDYDER